MPDKSKAHPRQLQIDLQFVVERLLAADGYKGDMYVMLLWLTGQAEGVIEKIRYFFRKKRRFLSFLNDFTCIIQKKVVLLHPKWLPCCNLLITN